MALDVSREKYWAKGLGRESRSTDLLKSIPRYLELWEWSRGVLSRKRVGGGPLWLKERKKDLVESVFHS